MKGAVGMRDAMIALVQDAQAQICAALCSINGTSIAKNAWEREEGGGGLACILPQGAVFEKGGVNVSTVSGSVFPEMLKAMPIQPKDPSKLRFFATGLSIVLHPTSPMIPTVHANYRYFEIEGDEEGSGWFFGGGADLTPYYLFEEDAQHFHQVLKVACEQHDSTLYAKLKQDADDYFYLPHRKEHRGVGGIFSLKYADRDPHSIFEWVKLCSAAFLPCYVPIVKRRQDLAFTPQEKHWQLIRRGRYAEFNLLYDLGTVFGLKSKGHTENILMSLPPQVSWEYNYVPEEGSREAKLLDVIKQPRQWA